ncbi:hypothetical protein PoB_000472800 [Plakobranchus ocellatus]|uniref:MLF1-interacting protein n=1 Tax=Plakobranchus ocellatus TaxID=259542 RepID=A0AAV3Y728_9GAST|nr:hypothetical protein PoB_000472800 [Plakobranchus ocellatus]
MKPSPRPPRRFSRWQTTKRTFVLGGVVSNSLPTHGMDQDPKQPNKEADTDITKDQPLSSIPAFDQASDSFNIDLRQSSQRSPKPKHVRKLKLDSSRLAAAEKANKSLSKPDVNKTSFPPSKLVGVKHRADLRNGTLHLEDKDVQYIALEGENMNSYEGSAIERPLEKNSKSDDNLTVTDVSDNSKSAVTMHVQTRSSPRKSSVSKSKRNGQIKSKMKNDCSKGAEHDLKSHPCSPGTDKENNDEEAESWSGHSHRESKIVSVAQTKDTLDPVLSVSSQSLDDASDTTSSISGDKSVTRQTSLRDRSRLMSSADMMEIWQYPEKFLTSAKKSIGQSLEKRDKMEENLQDTNTRKFALSDSTSTQKNASARSKVLKPNPKCMDDQQHEVSESFNKRSTVQELKSHSNVTNEAPIILNKSDILSKNMDTDYASPRIQDSAEYACQNQFEKYISVSENNKSPLNFKTKAIAESFRHYNKKHIASSKYQNIKNHMASSKKTFTMDVQDIGKRKNPPFQGEPSLLLQKESIVNTENTSLQGKLSATESDEFPSSERNSLVGLSLRDRSLLASPESVQKKRQYPISFYSSKKREDILNASALAKTKGMPKSKVLTRTDDSDLSNSKETQIELPEVSSKNKAKSLTLQNKDAPSKESSHLYSPESLNKQPSVSKFFPSKTTSKNHESSYSNPKKCFLSKQASSKEQPNKALSLPRRPTTKPRVHNNFGGKEDLAAFDSADRQQQEQQEPWDIVTASESQVKTVGARNKQKPTEPKSRTGSAIDETVLVRNKVPRKRKLVDQLYQTETSEKGKKTLQHGKSQQVLLWCEEEQTRPTSDVTAYDVIFQAVLDLEKELSETSEDRAAERLIKKVFSGFKRNIKWTIAQELSLRELEKNVRERKKRCKKLASDIATKHAESISLQKEIEYLESEKDGDLRKISDWMRSFSQLMLAGQDS